MRICTTSETLLQDLTSCLPDKECRLVNPGSLAHELNEGDIYLIDDATLRTLGESRESAAHATFVVYCGEQEAVPPSYEEGLADDLLLLPLRPLDLGRIIRMHELLMALRSAEESSQAIPRLVKQLQEDITLAEKIQRRLIREKFPAIGGLSVRSKYLCGLKSGGDYFDVFEFPDGLHVGIILTDCSSYSLSSSLLGALMQFSVHFGPAELENPALIVQGLAAKLRDGMKEKDRLSVFYGVLDRKTYRLRYVECGPVFAARYGTQSKISWSAKGEHAPLTRDKIEVGAAKEIFLEPGDRLVVASDGWGEATGEAPPRLFEKMLGEGREAQDFINELTYKLRRHQAKEQGGEEEEDLPMPPQDCSVLLFELGKNVLRLAR
jgi:hypothetical protein